MEAFMISLKILKYYLAHMIVGLASGLAVCHSAFASEWTPTRPIRLIVPSAAGAGGDITARLFAQRLGGALGQPVIVDNRGGAGGLIGTEAGAKSPPDGYTLVFGSDYAFTIHPQMAKTPYDPVKDFEPVGLVANVPLVLVVNPRKVSAQTVKELITIAKANPGKFTIASAGNGSSPHLAAEYFKHRTGTNLLHVPYKGASAALTDVLAGQADMMFMSPVVVLPYMKSGKLKALGVSVTDRIPVIANVPTLAEAGVPNFSMDVWMGFFYPAHTPKAAIKRVNDELQKILESPEIRARLAEMGYTPMGGKPHAVIHNSDHLRPASGRSAYVQ
jgi:tripartite-type tricarboxylate transporter receptor subunit TctC